MTDLELTRLCAEAMGYGIFYVNWEGNGKRDKRVVQVKTEKGILNWKPLHDDAQAMAMVKKFKLIVGPRGHSEWTADSPDGFDGTSTNLNRAICECVAKMQEGK